MNGLKLIECGSYLPAFFYMKVNTHESLEDLNVVSDESLQTFFHEYIHFLQDLFTSFGLQNILFNVNVLKQITLKIFHSPDKEFPIPYILPEDDKILKYKDLFSLFYGDDHTKPYDSVKEVKIIQNNLIKDYEDVKTVEVETCNSIDKTTSFFNFGSICMLEYIAYAIEKNLFNTKDTPHFPYKAPEEIANYLYPEFEVNDEVLIAISEFALDSQHPGPFFIDIISRMRTMNYKPTNYMEVRDFCAPYLLLERESGREITVEEQYHRQFEAARQALKDYFTTDTFSEAVEWLNRLFDMTIKIKPHFTFSKFIQSDGREQLIRLFHQIGSPIISNIDEMQYLYIPYNDQSDMNVPLFKAISIVYEILHGYRTNCTLKEHCNRHKTKRMVNYYCDYQPWKKIKKESLCPLMAIWTMWGLALKTPIIN